MNLKNNFENIMYQLFSLGRKQQNVPVTVNSVVCPRVCNNLMTVLVKNSMKGLFSEHKTEEIYEIVAYPNSRFQLF